MSANNTRRRFLAYGCAVGALGASGCLGGDDQDETGTGDSDDSAESADALGSVEDGFEECSPPDTATIDELVPTEIPDLDTQTVDPPSEGSHEEYELRYTSFREDPRSGESLEARVYEYESAPEEESDLGIPGANHLESTATPDTDIVVYVTVEKYAFMASGFEPEERDITAEEQAREVLAAFPSVSESCAETAATYEPEGDDF